MANQLILYCDGACRGNPGPASIGAILYKQQDGGEQSVEPVAEVSRSIGKATNNIAEYKSLIEGLKEAAAMHATINIDGIDVRMDSELVVKQIKGVYRVKNAGLRPLFEEAKKLLGDFPKWSIAHIRRELNGEADRLANEALDKAI